MRCMTRGIERQFNTQANLSAGSGNLWAGCSPFQDRCVTLAACENAEKRTQPNPATREDENLSDIGFEVPPRQILFGYFARITFGQNLSTNAIIPSSNAKTMPAP